MTTYLLNAFSVSMLPDGGIVEFDNLGSAIEAADAISDGFVSAVGHEPTALVFASLLGMPVPCARISVTLQPGDWAVVGQLPGRLPEGKVLTAEELSALPIRWVLVHVQREGEREEDYTPYHCATCANSIGEFCDARQGRK